MLTLLGFIWAGCLAGALALLALAVVRRGQPRSVLVASAAILLSIVGVLSILSVGALLLISAAIVGVAVHALRRRPPRVRGDLRRAGR